MTHPLSGNTPLPGSTPLPERPGQVLLLEDNETTGLRDGEGSVARAADGSLLLAYTHFEDGGADHSKAVVVTRRSTDGGATWSGRACLATPPAEALNVMSVSLLPLRDGRLACVYILKWTAKTRLIPYFCTSANSGRTWSAAVPVTEEEGYFVVNNDRLIQLDSGRLVLPSAHHRRKPGAEDVDDEETWNSYCGCFLSDDGGATWRKSRDWKRYEKANWREPAVWVRDNPEIAEIIRRRQNVLQEPGVVSLGGDRLYGWARSLCHIYRTWSDDGGETWQDFTALPDLAAPCAPASVKQLPDGSGLLMVYNDRGSVPYGDPQWHFRTPLSCAVSHDGGRTWRRVRALEPDDSRNYCYTSLWLEPEQSVATYYVSAPASDPAKPQKKRRNLASLRVHRFRIAELLG